MGYSASSPRPGSRNRSCNRPSCNNKVMPLRVSSQTELYSNQRRAHQRSQSSSAAPLLNQRRPLEAGERLLFLRRLRAISTRPLYRRGEEEILVASSPKKLPYPPKAKTFQRTRSRDAWRWPATMPFPLVGIQTKARMWWGTRYIQG